MTPSARVDTSIEERLAFIGLDKAAQERLRKLKPTIAKAIGPALDHFYAKARQTEATAHFFRDDGHARSAKARQESHWMVMVDAEFGQTYADAVTTIGHNHARLGLEPRWYIGGYALIAERLIEAVVADHWPSFQLGKGGGHQAARCSICGA